ncbi:MAG: hypothetical protein K2O84_03805 [Oscillospiraceae bacterium]|nr:hypothetical protein [Oscillospiraceae bacterium]
MKLNYNKMQKRYTILFLFSIFLMNFLVGCSGDVLSTEYATEQNIQDTKNTTEELTYSQKIPTDINYSLERYNLIRRAYWVNGQREKANTLLCEVEKPLGYIILFAGNATVGRFVVDGKVSSLNSFLSPNFVETIYKDRGEYGGGNVIVNTELADIDGSYGENDFGIFFFTPDGKYVEWTGEYLYSDIPFEVDSPVVSYQETK